MILYIYGHIYIYFSLYAANKAAGLADTGKAGKPPPACVDVPVTLEQVYLYVHVCTASCSTRRTVEGEEHCVVCRHGKDRETTAYLRRRASHSRAGIYILQCIHAYMKRLGLN